MKTTYFQWIMLFTSFQAIVLCQPVRKIQEVCIYGFGVKTRSSLWYDRWARYAHVFAYDTFLQFGMLSCQVQTTLASFLKCFKCLSEESYPSSQ
jgi:hypothetical protein